jgi:hypothetical protein
VGTGQSSHQLDCRTPPSTHQSFCAPASAPVVVRDHDAWHNPLQAKVQRGARQPFRQCARLAPLRLLPTGVWPVCWRGCPAASASTAPSAPHTSPPAWTASPAMARTRAAAAAHARSPAPTPRAALRAWPLTKLNTAPMTSQTRQAAGRQQGRWIISELPFQQTRCKAVRPLAGRPQRGRPATSAPTPPSQTR